MVGTPNSIVDEMQEWFETKGSDGFTIMFSHLPSGLEDFCDLVVPELQRRGLFRSKYVGKTLRENLGLPRPSNKYFERYPIKKKNKKEAIDAPIPKSIF